MSRVTAKFQITIPPEVRTDLDIVPGCEVEIRKEGERYVLVVDPITALKKAWRGRFNGKQKTDEYLDQIRGEAN